jgi:hypothetical protein
LHVIIGHTKMAQLYAPSLCRVNGSAYTKDPTIDILICKISHQSAEVLVISQVQSWSESPRLTPTY